MSYVVLVNNSFVISYPTRQSAAAAIRQYKKMGQQAVIKDDEQEPLSLFIMDTLKEVLDKINVPYSYLPILKGIRRTRELVKIRVLLSKELHDKGYTYSQIGRVLNKDNTTIGYYVRGKK